MRVLLVCLGNICRSPTAEAVLRARVQARGLGRRVEIDSCGTGDWHIGKAPDQRAQAAAAMRGYDLSTLRARQLCDQDFQVFDLILAMDEENFSQLCQRMPATASVSIKKFLDFHPDVSGADVPDPYYGGADGFDQVLDLVEQGSDALLSHYFPEPS